MVKRKRFLKITFTVLGIFLGLLLIAAALLFQPLDREFYKDKPHYARMKKTLDSIPVQHSHKLPLRAGWAKVNIIPQKPVPLASYGLRDKYEKVHDTVWCRAFVLDNGEELVAMVTVDLLIFPPSVAAKLKKALPALGIREKNLYLTASHTHNAPGGWAEGVGGRILAGPWNEEYVNFLADAVKQAIQKAKNDLSPAAAGFEKTDAGKILYNRLSSDEDDLDRWVRLIRIRKENGSNAVIVSYAGHSNILKSTVNEVSGDYAGALVDSLEQMKEVDFAAFFAGAVATHACRDFDTENFRRIELTVQYLLGKIKPLVATIPMHDSLQITTLKVPVCLRDPQMKISRDWKIRPWVFKALFQEQEVYVSAVRLGDIVLAGTPCDFSGELAKVFDPLCERRHIHLIVTSFNGGYVGYIIPDKYYDLSKREPRDMDWFGPYMGAYFTEIIETVLQKI